MKGPRENPKTQFARTKLGSHPLSLLCVDTNAREEQGVGEEIQVLVPQARVFKSRTFCGPDRGLWIGQQMKATVSSGLARVPFRNTPLGTATNIQVQGMCLCGDLPWVGLTEKSGVHSRPGAKLCKSHVAVVVLSDSAGRGAKGGQDGRPSARRRLSLLH